MFILLSYLGACHPEDPYAIISKLARFSIVIFLALFKGLWVIPYSGGFPKVSLGGK